MVSNLPSSDIPIGRFPIVTPKVLLETVLGSKKESKRISSHDIGNTCDHSVRNVYKTYIGQ
jgi:hypothetical protein